MKVVLRKLLEDEYPMGSGRYVPYWGHEEEILIDDTVPTLRSPKPDRQVDDLRNCPSRTGGQSG